MEYDYKDDSLPGIVSQVGSDKQNLVYCSSKDSVRLGGIKHADDYDKDSKLHQNYVIADTLGVIENVLLFSISNYFRKVSLEYKNYWRLSGMTGRKP